MIEDLKDGSQFLVETSKNLGISLLGGPTIIQIDGPIDFEARSVGWFLPTLFSPNTGSSDLECFLQSVGFLYPSSRKKPCIGVIE